MEKKIEMEAGCVRGQLQDWPVNCRNQEKERSRIEVQITRGKPRYSYTIFLDNTI